MQKRNNEWLTFAEAAESLGVDVRTIKRWMRRPETRTALLAVRHGKQWRIPRPANVDLWAWEMRARLKTIGICLKEVWEKQLERLAKEDAPYWPEARRLYLAACAKALRRGRITEKARLGIDLLYHAAVEVLRREQRQCGVETLRLRFPRDLLRYWPAGGDFKAIQNANTLKAIEAERQRVDFVQAVRTLHRRDPRRGKSAKHLCPLLHSDWLAHVNDTKEKLSPGTNDRRLPQPGISLAQFRRRYPLRKKPWRSIIARVEHRLGAIPGAEETPHSGKTPIRGSKLSEGLALRLRPAQFRPFARQRHARG